MESAHTLYIGLLGLGTVGRGVVRSLESNRMQIESRTGSSIKVLGALVRHVEKPRNLDTSAFTVTDDPQTILADPRIDVVVEVMGGVEPARSYIRQALLSRKHVVTANKELLARHGDELGELADRQGVRLLFEASVAGGIPVVRMVQQYLTANRITSIRGILNGTCNYILTKMEEDGLSFADALQNAQRLGYAEADPQSDVEGYDSSYKLAILANMAFPIKSPVSAVERQGITQISEQDISSARNKGCVIRLIGEAVYDGQKVNLRVGPRLLPRDDALAGVRDVFNAVTLTADVVGDLTFIGRGAGELPTASAVIEDLMEVLRTPSPYWNAPLRSFGAPEANDKGGKRDPGAAYFDNLAAPAWLRT
ncbi:MAG: homoserine dehydrogenase [Bacilli bacterium]